MQVTDLYLAAEKGDVVQLEEILGAEPHLVNALSSDGLTALGIAAHYGQVEAVRTLLRLGADVNQLSQSKIPFIPSNTALHAAIAGDRSVEVVKILLDHGADVTLTDSNHHTPLQAAAFNGNVEIGRLLLEKGADVNAQHCNSQTALAISRKQGHTAFVELLLQYGARE
jgi:ankyrin repeat protein